MSKESPQPASRLKCNRLCSDAGMAPPPRLHPRRLAFGAGGSAIAGRRGESPALEAALRDHSGNSSAIPETLRREVLSGALPVSLRAMQVRELHRK